MKRYYFLCICLLYACAAISQVTDDFSDGNFTSNPAWSGDVSKFEVNAPAELHLNAPAVTDTACLNTPNSSIDNTEWNFYFKMDFSPSSSNYLKVYLVADQQDFRQPLNGYFLKMGADGSDDAIDLYVQQGTTETLIVPGIAGHVAASVNTVSIQVTRDNAGNWSVYSDLSGGTNYSLEGTGLDNTITTTAYFGFFCKYTSTRSTAFYFDNIYVGQPVVDTDPPQLQQVSVISSTQLDVSFNETLDEASAENTTHYVVNNSVGNPSSAQLDATDKKLVHLTFTTAFPNGITNTLTVTDIQDLNGNILTSATADFVFYDAQKNDVVINEMMADPDPAVSLPAAEFTELYNHSAFPIDLSGWTFSDGTTTQTLSAFILNPDTFLILCDDGNTALFSSYGNVMGLSSFPSMNNDGDVLTLKDASGNIINTVSYSSAWYKDDVKAAGGWTLELIDPSSPCQGSNNWIASNDPSGGTPGRTNSVNAVNPDVTAPQLIRASIVGLTTVELTFSESLDSAVAADVSHYVIDPAQNILAASVSSPDFTVVTLQISPGIDTNIVYTVTVSGISDCTGNLIDTANHAEFAIPALITTGSILINEILFNPKSGGYDYLEIYNNSGNSFDLKDLKVATTDDEDSISTTYDVTTGSYLFLPGQYMVLTENAAAVKDQYVALNPDWFIEMDLPSFNDDEGVAVLLNADGSRIDQLHYFDNWQFPLIDDPEGVALERISFAVPTQDSLSWHSAASTVGYGTPSYQNSQYTNPETGNEITLSPEVFSPDEDGFNDILTISYQFDQAGYTANVTIFDAAGRDVKDLVKNTLLSQSGFFTWDGINSRNEKAPVGIYIVYTELFKLDGTINHYKNVCVVGGRKS